MDAAPATPPRDDLSQLVRERRSKLDRSLSQLVRASQSEELHESWINRLEHNQLRTIPTPKRLAALARALDLPYSQLADAAARQYLGVEQEWSEDGTARAVLARMEGMTAEDRSALLAMVEAFARSRTPQG